MGIDFSDLFTADEDDTALVAYDAKGRHIIGTTKTVEVDGRLEIHAVITDPNYIHLVDDGTNSNYSIGPLNADVPPVP